MRNNIRAALTEGFNCPIRDPLWGHVYLTPQLEDIVKSPPFMRLHRILQLGPVSVVYPGATHTRAGHSIGVFHLAHRLIRTLAEYGADEWLTEVGVRSFLAASLLHDIGHFPYAHSLKELLLISHEELTGRAILAEPLKSLVGKSGADPAMTAAIIDAKLETVDAETCFYRKLLSGALDPDKLDYLNRDAYYAGVPYGAQDVDFILSRLKPHVERGVDIDSKGIPCVESILFSKYLMYRTVYWHRDVRSATCMIKKALIDGLKRSVITEEELYNLDDQGLFILMRDRACRLPILSLGEQVRDGRIYESIVEFPFDEMAHIAQNIDFLDINKRSLFEEQLAEKITEQAKTAFGQDDVIIDVPETVSFETGLLVTDENSVFSESSALFKKEMVRAFRKVLRTVRVFVAKKHDSLFNPLHFSKDLIYSIL
ncbi:MAG: HD domain-containing protein [Treponema sp.]|jgi:HD superfamily phosphohydrolase|nr:HD domain-containing protein [Treponema sp.]